MPGDTLSFVHSTSRPATDVRVFAATRQQFLGTEFTFRVVGNSHFVSAPAYDFHELSSCEPVAGPEGAEIPLDPEGPSRELTFETDRLSCETLVDPRPLDAFPAERSFDVAYRFEADAYTTIDLLGDGFETYHTYPERDLALYSRTRFAAVPTEAGASRAVAASRSGPE